MSAKPPDDPGPGAGAGAPAPSDPELEAPANASRSIDVQFSSTTLPAVEALPPRRRPRPSTVPAMIAESLSNLPVVKEVMPKTRKGKVLLRSIVVAFGLIGMWIGVIIYLQLRAGGKPDFREQVEAIFVDLRDGEAAHVYQHSSTRFQELMLEETFEDQIADMIHTLGPFKEVAAVIRTETFRGPSGRTARVDLLLEFESGRARGSMSFHYEDAQWRMLGYSVDIPENLAVAATSPEARAQRVRAPKEIEELTAAILVQSRDGLSDDIWLAAAPVFQQSITRTKFNSLEVQRRETVGPFRRILDITRSQQNPAQTGATVDALLEYGTGVTIPGTFKFSKIDGVWKLAFYKLIMPMPDAPDVPAP